MRRKAKVRIGLALAAGVTALGGIAGLANAEVPTRTVKFTFENSNATSIQLCVSNTNGAAEQCADVPAQDTTTMRPGRGGLDYSTDQQEILVKTKDQDGPGDPRRVKLPDDAKEPINCVNSAKFVACGEQ